MHKVPYRMEKHEAAALRRKVKKFRRLISQAEPLAAEIDSYVRTFAPLSSPEGEMMRTISLGFKENIHMGRAMDAETLAERIIEIHQQEEVEPRSGRGPTW